ncbi:hypothetical protein POL68_40270 [Stigmatella sp. ncwal1]|uniref:Bulb-type lectin domain-containing protein n=1 Tax=Stigmatella ashevillensis TaxID=2995309 RepID=A0ABT5DNM3_9BACT|nr:hypothetical protein [Stigmatella ashevillena]MDC0714755.1 hypothetical protein [Stigmatella ashevillena]
MAIVESTPFAGGPILSLGQYLAPGQYMASRNGLYFAGIEADGTFHVYAGNERRQIYVMSGTSYKKDPTTGNQFYAVVQPDGNFVVYQGTVPDNSHPVWGIEQAWFKKPQGNAFYALLQDDGNFVVYQGQPGDNSTPLWATNAWMTTVSIAMTNVRYDLDNAKVMNQQLANSTQQMITNKSAVQQSESFTFDLTYTTSSTFSLQVGQTSTVSAGVSLSIEAGIPLFEKASIDASLTVSAESSFSRTSGVEVTQGQRYSGTIPVVVPADSVINCTATVSTAQMQVPFTANGTYTLALHGSSNRFTVTGPVQGSYNATSAFYLNTTFDQQTPSIAAKAA